MQLVMHTLSLQIKNGAVQMNEDANPDWLLRFKIPQFLKRTSESIQRAQISKGVRTEIVSCIAWEIWQSTQFPSSEDYSAVCKMLVQKHPILRDTIY